MSRFRFGGAGESPRSVRFRMVTIPLVATAVLSVAMGIFPGYFSVALAECSDDQARRRFLR